MGDNALVKVSHLLQKYTKRSGDFAFRVGGEEFTILLNSSSEESIEYFENLRKDIENLSIPHKENPPFNVLTLSIGVTKLLHYENVTTDTLYKFTDDNLYRAKEEGRNRIHSSSL